MPCVQLLHLSRQCGLDVYHRSLTQPGCRNQLVHSPSWHAQQANTPISSCFLLSLVQLRTSPMAAARPWSGISGQDAHGRKGKDDVVLLARPHSALAIPSRGLIRSSCLVGIILSRAAQWSGLSLPEHLTPVCEPRESLRHDSKVCRIKPKQAGTSFSGTKFGPNVLI